MNSWKGIEKGFRLWVDIASFLCVTFLRMVTKPRTVMPKSLVNEVLRLCHDLPVIGQEGYLRT
ncbi:hypothetical protein MHBO_005161 [Bonamia ostreae]|uniref:Transposase n=1 Tax=Bonamia ostreae TaxID=126728 RepID=A0ABV2AVD0_9EUKA